MSAKVGTKGQVVIEKVIRDALGVKAGCIAVQTLVANHVEIHFYPPEHDTSLQGILAGSRRKSVSPEEWPAARRHAWQAAAREEWEGASDDDESTARHAFSRYQLHRSLSHRGRPGDRRQGR